MKAELKQLVYKTFGKESYRGYSNEQCELITNFCYEQLTQKQNDIDELVEFIDRQISESNFINEGYKFEAYELIKKHTKK